jgi:protein-L-isoaspartate(D-aspartate) O-methyltransferase
MTEKLEPRPSDKILEIGTGSGYQAAVLSGLVKDVYTIEIVGALGRRASATLRRLGYLNVHPRIGDGFQGWPQHAPYDKIIVTCSPERVPEPLVAQLKEGGRLIIPVGERYQQILYFFKKVDGKLVVESREPTMFVPMTGVAEQTRELQPDSAKPKLINGGFEQTLQGAADQPAGWYYVRQARLADDSPAPEGKTCLSFSNSHVGRSAQALQAVGVDGEQVTDLEISYWVRLDRVVAGTAAEQTANLNITFFDADRAPIGQGEMPAGEGDAPWAKRQTRLKVPRAARLAVIAIGLFGATGEARFDAVEVRPLGKPSARLSRVGR